MHRESRMVVKSPSTLFLLIPIRETNNENKIIKRVILILEENAKIDL